MSYLDGADDAGQDVEFERSLDGGAVWCGQHERDRFGGDDSCRHLHPLVETWPEPVQRDYTVALVVLTVLALACGSWTFLAFIGMTPFAPSWVPLVLTVLCVVAGVVVAARESYDAAWSEMDR